MAKPRLVVVPNWAVHLGVTEQGHEARDPTAADLLAHLAQTPATALQIAEQLRVARAWWQDLARNWFRFDGREELGDEDAARALHVTPMGHVWYADGGWRGAVYGSPLDDTWFLDSEAREAVDAALTDVGTILVSR